MPLSIWNIPHMSSEDWLWLVAFQQKGQDLIGYWYGAIYGKKNSLSHSLPLQKQDWLGRMVQYEPRPADRDPEGIGTDVVMLPSCFVAPVRSDPGHRIQASPEGTPPLPE